MDKKSKDYSCEICNKIYATYKTLWKHNKQFHTESKHRIVSKSKHTENETDDEINCVYCGKTYKHKQSKWRHEKTCEEKDSIINLKKKIDKIENENLKLKLKLNQMLKENLKNKINNVQEIKSNITEKKAENTEINSNNNNNTNEIMGDNNIMNSVNIVNNFNSDNLSFITPQIFKKLLKETLFEEDFYKVIPKVIEEVKFNIDHKENHNVKLKNSKSKYGEIYINDKWQEIEDDYLIDYLTKRGYQIYEDLSTIHKDQIVKRYIDSTKNFEENYLKGGNLKLEEEKKMKDIVIEGTTKIMYPEYDPIKRKKEIMEEKFIIPTKSNVKNKKIVI